MKSTFVPIATLVAVVIASAAYSLAQTPAPSRVAQLEEAVRDPKVVRQGKKLYASLCANCHGAEGTGGDAPTNLFDTKWIYGGRPEQIWATVNNGALEKGMPPWQGAVAEEDLVAVTAYLLSKRAQ